MTIAFKTTRRGFQLTALAFAAAFAGHAALAQSFPERPMKIVVGAPAGGTADVVARALAEGMSRSLGQPIIVDNKPGGAGIIGLQELLRQPHDGYTLMIAVNGLASEIPHVVKMPVDPLKELRPVAELARTGLLLVGTPNFPANDLKGVVAHVKANPGKISYASYSTGTVSHTLGLAFNQIAGLDLQHVGYRGSPPALTDVMGGTVPLMFDGPATSIPLLKAGKIKAFATTAPQRLGALPNVPTFAELGYKDMTEVAWMGLWTTPDVPAANQARIRDAALAQLQTPKIKELFAGLGLDIGSGATPDELTRSLRVASDKQAATLKAIGFKPE